MAVQISIPVANVSDLLTLGYTKIEVWLSTDGGGNYNEITDTAVKAAYLESANANTTYRMGGKLLKFKIDGSSEISVTFSAIVVYWTPTQVANRINEVVVGLASVVGSHVKLTSPTTGRSSEIEITYNDASDLGFVEGQKAYGKEARPTLSSGTLIYTFSDSSGSGGYRYKWRFSANGVNPISDYSAYVLGSVPPYIPEDKLSVTYASFVGVDGKPIKRKVIVVSESPPIKVSECIVGDEVARVFESGDDGFLQFSLVRGSKVRIAIEGTSLVRVITVPDAATFDLLTALSDAPDLFTVQTPPPYLYRRSI